MLNAASTSDSLRKSLWALSFSGDVVKLVSGGFGQEVLTLQSVKTLNAQIGVCLWHGLLISSTYLILSCRVIFVMCFIWSLATDEFARGIKPQKTVLNDLHHNKVMARGWWFLLVYLHVFIELGTSNILNRPCS